MSYAPLPDEIEISVFGSGYGECILVHLGNNDWIIIDSFLDPSSKIPTPLSYLQQIGVDPATSVKQVVATHWHDDHISGLGSIVEKCSSAEFVCSDAINSIEFYTLVYASGTRPMMRNSPGVKEFCRVLRVLEERRSSPKFAVENLCLSGDLKLKLPAEIYALSPSHHFIYITKKEIASFLPKEQTPKKRLSPKKDNHGAIVLLISIGKICILLGSDLEETGDKRMGWSRIIKLPLHSNKKSSLFKIPHHGSQNADLPEVWSEMLEVMPFAALTTFSKAREPLPTQSDIKRNKRICGRTNNAYIAGKSWLAKSRKREKVVEKTIREAGIKIKQLSQSVGQVRFRAKLSANDNRWKVDLFGQAFALKEGSS